MLIIAGFGMSTLVLTFELLFPTRLSGTAGSAVAPADKGYALRAKEYHTRIDQGFEPKAVRVRIINQLSPSSHRMDSGVRHRGGSAADHVKTVSINGRVSVVRVVPSAAAGGRQKF